MSGILQQPIRDLRADELNFVRATWTNSHAFQLHRYERPKVMPSFRRFIDSVLDTRPRIVVWETGDTLHGWACAAPGERLYYAYLPKDLRGKKLSRALVEAAYGAYPERILTAYPWPYASARFQFEPWRKAA